MKKLTSFAVFFSVLTFSVPFQAEAGNCCCTNCLCNPGTQGDVGSPGPQGVQGALGPQGIPGAQGLEGIQGDTGPAGPCRPLQSEAFANIYTTVAQTVPPLAAFTFENVNSATEEIDISSASTTGEIVINQEGWYELYYDIDGLLANFNVFPTPVWSVSFYLNGTLLPGSTQCGFSGSRAAILTHITGNVIIYINVGDVLELINTSSSATTIRTVNNPLGATVPNDCCTISIKRISP